MSVVFRATQDAPIRQDVALKVLKPGMDSAAVLARFESERQILAAMDHPNIARVLDAGLVDEGRPYFAMELVRGAPLDTFCNQRQLTVDERIDLFLTVCRGVHHAHMRAVIHRDLKPSNILVADHEGVPVPKIIDFGVSKAVHLATTAHETLAGHPVGTPAFMSPEQWDSDADLDVRADVYSLGIVLDLLLTGTDPYGFKTNDDAAMNTIRAQMEQSEPTRMSDRVGRSDSRPAAGMEHTTRRALAASLRPELDWIVLKAIAKDKSERYSSVEAFADDLRRTRENHPIVARPPGPMARCRKFCRRHQLFTIVCMLVTVLLAGGVIGTGIGLLQALRENDRANKRAAELELVADFQASQLAGIDAAQMGDQIQQSILDGLPEPQHDAARELLAPVNFTDVARSTMDRVMIERSVQAIRDQFVEQPAIRARLLQSSAQSALRLGLPRTALEPQREALELNQAILGERHPETLVSMSLMGRLLRLSGDDAAAAPYYEEALRLNLAVRGDEHTETLIAKNNLGVLRYRQGRFTEAAALYRDVLKTRRRVLGDEHFDTTVSMSSLALVLQHLGDLEDAETYLRTSLATRRRLLGDTREPTIVALINLGALLAQRHAFDEAEDHLREAIESATHTLGDEHPRALDARNALATLLHAARRLDEAVACSTQTLNARRKVLGDDHPKTVISMINLATLLRDVGDLERADLLGAEAVERSRTAFGPGHWRHGRHTLEHARTQFARDRFPDADSRARTAYKILEAARGSASPEARDAARMLGDLHTRWNALQPTPAREEAATHWRRLADSKTP